MQRDELNRLISDIMQLVDVVDDNNLAKVKDYVDSYNLDEIDWKSKYDEMKDRYTTRFFTTEEQIIDDQEIDIEKDTTAYKDIDELFVKREGDYNA